MKNSTIIKGSAAIALGAALLLGGGGTLAAWNATTEATAPGIITAGNLDVAAAPGAWADRAGTPITDIGAYRVVPGDKLTYKQEITLTLVGDKMAATITPNGTDLSTGFDPNNVSVSAPKLTLANGAQLPGELTAAYNGQKITAEISFEFLAGTSGRQDVAKSYNFGNVTFTVQQVVAGKALVAGS